MQLDLAEGRQQHRHQVLPERRRQAIHRHPALEDQVHPIHLELDLHRQQPRHRRRLRRLHLLLRHRL